MSRTRTHALIHHPTVRRAARVAAHLSTVGLILLLPGTAYADPGDTVILAANSLPVVIGNLQTWIMGLLAAIATLFLVLGGPPPGPKPTRPERRPHRHPPAGDSDRTRRPFRCSPCGWTRRWISATGVRAVDSSPSRRTWSGRMSARCGSPR
jgi:hypothetical protein